MAKNKGKILVVDDNSGIRAALKLLLPMHFAQVELIPSPNELISRLADFLIREKCGQGQAVKAINQLLVGVHMCATAEAFTLASRCGLDLNTMYEVICTSAGCSQIFKNRGKFLIDRDFSTRSTLQIQLKDADVVCKTADQVGAPIPLTNMVRELFKLAVRKYPPTDDSLEVVRLYEEMCAE